MTRQACTRCNNLFSPEENPTAGDMTMCLSCHCWLVLVNFFETHTTDVLQRRMACLVALQTDNNDDGRQVVTQCS